MRPTWWSTRTRAALSDVSGLVDHVEHKAGLGKHRDVAAVGLESGLAHALRDEALQLGLDGAVLIRNDVPARLRLPRSAFDLLGEKVRRRGGVRCPDDFLLLLGWIACKGRDPVRLHPDAPIHDFDV